MRIGEPGCSSLTVTLPIPSSAVQLAVTPSAESNKHSDRSTGRSPAGKPDSTPGLVSAEGVPMLQPRGLNATLSRTEELLRASPYWSRASSLTLRRLAEACRIVERRPGQVFLVEGAPAETVYLLTRGQVRFFFSARRGRPEVTTRVVGAPGRFGDVAALLRTPEAVTVEATVDSVALALDANTYLRALEREPSCAFSHYAALARDLATSLEHERCALSGGLAERTIAILIAYADPLEGIVRLSQDDLAQLVGSTRRTIARLMQRMYASGGLARVGRRYVILDVAALKRA